MFIEPLLTTNRAPAERNVSGPEWEIEHVSLRWSDEEPFGGRHIHKHFVLFDAWDEGAAAEKLCKESRKLRTYHAETAELMQRRVLYTER